MSIPIAITSHMNNVMTVGGFQVGDRVFKKTDSKKVEGTVIGFFGGCLHIEWKAVSGRGRRAKAGVILPEEVLKAE